MSLCDCAARALDGANAVHEAQVSFPLDATIAAASRGLADALSGHGRLADDHDEERARAAAGGRDTPDGPCGAADCACARCRRAMREAYAHVMLPGAYRSVMVGSDAAVLARHIAGEVAAASEARGPAPLDPADASRAGGDARHDEEATWKLLSRLHAFKEALVRIARGGARRVAQGRRSV